MISSPRVQQLQCDYWLDAHGYLIQEQELQGETMGVLKHHSADNAEASQSDYDTYQN